MFLVFHEIFRLAVLINFVLIKKKECTALSSQLFIKLTLLNMQVRITFKTRLKNVDLEKHSGDEGILWSGRIITPTPPPC